MFVFQEKEAAKSLKRSVSLSVNIDSIKSIFFTLHLKFNRCAIKLRNIITTITYILYFRVIKSITETIKPGHYKVIIDRSAPGGVMAHNR